MAVPKTAALPLGDAPTRLNREQRGYCTHDPCDQYGKAALTGAMPRAVSRAVRAAPHPYPLPVNGEREASTSRPADRLSRRYAQGKTRPSASPSSSRETWRPPFSEET